MQMVIEAKDLIKRYGSGPNAVYALKGLDFHAEQGEFVSIVGASGSGKTTLLHILGGLDSPTQGDVFIRGKNIRELSEEELAVFRRRNTGFVFQNYNLIPVLSVYDNIILPIELDGASPDRSFIKDLLSVLGIEDKQHSMPNELSGGQQQRVAIARAIATKPAIILADEPTGNLDSKNGLEVIMLMQRLSKQYNQTIIVITHNEEIAQMANRLVHIADGRVVAS